MIGFSYNALKIKLNWKHIVLKGAIETRLKKVMKKPQLFHKSVPGNRFHVNLVATSIANDKNLELIYMIVANLVNRTCENSALKNLNA